MFRRRGPGLVRAAATTAVVVGTAGAVRHRQDQKYAAKDQAAYDRAAGRLRPGGRRRAASRASRSRPQPDYVAELEKLAQLKGQGLISDEDYEAKKKQILGI